MYIYIYMYVESCIRNETVGCVLPECVVELGSEITGTLIPIHYIIIII